VTVRAKVDPESGLCRVIDDVTGPVEEANAFLRAVAMRGLSPLTVRAYAFDLVALYRWMTATDRALVELSQPDLLDFVRHERERGAHPSSINRRLSTCRLVHRFWQPDGLGAAAGTSLPAPYYRSPGRDRRLGMHVLKKKRELVLRVKTPRKQIVPLSAKQAREFLRGLRRYRDHAIVHLMLLCGLRSREVLLLGRHDVSLLERRVRVSGKGNKERIVPLADLAAVSVEQYLKHERPPDCADEALFVCLQGKRRGKSMTPSGLRSLFRGRRSNPALANANPHRFRHTFGADMARSGVSLPVIQKLMGHENPVMTLRYINLSLADIADAYRLAAAEIQKRYDPDE
jgi:integrase/recombinase XerD